MSAPPDHHAAPVLRVAHADLAPYHDQRWARVCPTCREGLLLARRDLTLLILAEDLCTRCGQRVCYTDVARLREADGPGPEPDGIESGDFELP